MKTKVRLPLTSGDPAPDEEGKTDEGTSVSLADFEGRTLAVFFTGRGQGRTKETLIRGIQTRIKEFLDCNCSPLVVSADSVEVLAARRDEDDLPFLMISDPELHIHRAFSGAMPGVENRGAWVIDDSGRISAALAPMPPREQISAVLSFLTRISPDSTPLPPRE